MLSTGRLLRATKLLCDLKTIEGTKKCSFHVYTLNSSVKLGKYVFRRHQRPVAVGFVNFASSDASVGPPATPNSQVLSNNMDDMKVLSELGIIPPFEEAIEAPEFKNIDTPALLDEVEMKHSQDALGLQDEAMVDISTAGIPGEQHPVSSQDFDSEGLHLSNFESSKVLEHEGLVISSEPTEPELDESEVLLESMFESSVIPEINSSPLDGSFEPIPLEADSTKTIDQPTVEAKIDPLPTNPHIEAPIELPSSPLIPDAAAGTGGIQELTATSPELLTAVAENIGRFGGEPSLKSIGLASNYPPGLVQQALEFFHVGMDLPWWGAIALGTVIIRLCVFPLVIMSQRNAAKMNNNLPEMQAIQLKMSDARERGDRLDAARYATELMEFMSARGLNPLKNMIPPLCQAPIFISMFMGLRAMANAPVESFREGGIWWFVDLTMPDQFYLLPLITSATLALTIEVGADLGKLGSTNYGVMKYLIRGMPIILFPFTMNFPAGVLVYWCSTNFISLIQVGILRIPAVRDYFKIERLIKIDKKKLPIKEKGFVGGIKESWTNIRISRELEERERLDNANFNRAGRGAIKKTYKFDPTQPRPPRNLSSIQLKKRD